MYDHTALYLLQPGLDQSISVAKAIKGSTPSVRIVGVVRPNERLRPSPLIDHLIVVADYKDLPTSLSIIPTGAPSTEALLHDRPVILGEVCMDSRALDVYDKKKFLAVCKNALLPVPKTYSCASEIPQDAFPIFFKESHEKGGGVRGLAFYCDEIPAHRPGDLIFQEYIDSPGTYGVGFIAKRGVVLTTFAHFERESYPESGGSAVLVESVDDPRLIDLTDKVVAALGYSGWGLAEFKFSRKLNDYVFMEVNAKFWASCDFAFKNNPEFLRLLFGIHSPEVRTNRQFYINRAFLRGPSFVLRWLPEILSSEIVSFPGLPRSVVRGLFPRWITRLRSKC